MAGLATSIHENSEKFLPAFARIRAANGKAVRYAPLDFHYSGSSPQPAPGERTLARWVTIAGCMITVTDQGLPLRESPGPQTGHPTRLFTGGAELLLTDRRLLGTVINGETVVGAVNDKNGFLLAFSYPLERIESVDVDLERKMFGGVKEARLNIMTITGDICALAIDDVIAELGSGPRGFQRYRGTKRDILEALVAPIVAARRPHTGQAGLRVLDAAERGVRKQDADSIAVEFVSD